MFRITDPLCYRDLEDLYEGDYKRGIEKGITGEDLEVIRYADGTSKVIWGGPCGSTCYDENGEEI